MNIKTLTIAASIAAGLSTALLGSAGPAVAAPDAARNADATIMRLEDQGNRVIVTRLSATPLEDSSVVSITHGPLVRHAVPFATSQGDNTLSVSSQTVYVTVR